MQHTRSRHCSGGLLTTGIPFYYVKDSIYACLVSRVDATTQKNMMPLCSVLHMSYTEGLPDCQIMSHTLAPLKVIEGGEELRL
jgi:hypothetical protein